MFRGTTILAVRKNGQIAICGDGQVTAGNTILKGNTKKVKRIFNGKVATGFAGATADAFTLFEIFEGKLGEYGGDLVRSAVEMAKLWRTDKQLSKLDALMIVTDGKNMLMLSGTGDVIEPDGDVLAIGSGGDYARAAATAYLDSGVDLTAEEIARKSLTIAGNICIYTNNNLVCEVLNG